MAESNPRGHVGPDPARVRAPVGEAVAHRAHQFRCPRFAKPALEIEETRYAAHDDSPLNPDPESPSNTGTFWKPSSSQQRRNLATADWAVQRQICGPDVRPEGVGWKW